MAHPIGPPVAHGIKVRQLTNDKQEAVVMSLSERSRDGVLPCGAITELRITVNERRLRSKCSGDSRVLR